MTTAVIVARFQTPHLHEGHRRLLQEVTSRHSKLVIVLGIGPLKGSMRNPYDYYTREKMIKKDFAEAVILPLNDYPCDREWSQNLDNLLKGVFPNEVFCLYGSRDSFIPYYCGRFQTVELPEHGGFSATELRKQYADKVFDSNDFRAGILYAYYNQYNKVFPTVDIAVFRHERTEILLGKKTVSSKWRLIGGFADPEDQSYEHAARRELTEECGAIETGEMIYETSARIDDWRYRNETDKIISLLFSCEYLTGMYSAQDDLLELQWFKLNDLPKMMTAGETTAEHAQLLTFLIKKYLKNK
ncbi:NUDIX domain-containing protein [Pedobacter sp. SYP-B3415]|uniref:NUDIX domain-containing protein n=1 Tax=Pedobacter sp. SYP-B3415 TaxID=2496641 RepID=UPI00101DBF57|nr:NUDIX domain-containing protein [Pedobacter sp. SYP-B3415]